MRGWRVLCAGFAAGLAAAPPAGAHAGGDCRYGRAVLPHEPPVEAEVEAPRMLAICDGARVWVRLGGAEGVALTLQVAGGRPPAEPAPAASDDEPRGRRDKDKGRRGRRDAAGRRHCGKRREARRGRRCR